VTLTQLNNEISEFYIKQFIKGIYKILGSFTIFGNPYMFMRLVAEGAWEVVNQPTEGFIKGPLEGMLGIGKGGVFFTRNVIAGTFNSFEAISESLSRGISYMTLDEKFIERR
jgi:vacuolar protein sorting-associated protein 13A/C